MCADERAVCILITTAYVIFNHFTDKRSCHVHFVKFIFCHLYKYSLQYYYLCHFPSYSLFVISSHTEAIATHTHGRTQYSLLFLPLYFCIISKYNWHYWTTLPDCCKWKKSRSCRLETSLNSRKIDTEKIK